jgi:glycine dehydrogenase
MASLSSSGEVLEPPDRFQDRHIGPREEDLPRMLQRLGLSSLEALVREALPPSILLRRPLELDPPRTERQVLEELAELASRNQVFRSYIGMGFYGTVLPPVIRRSVLENPGWYTQYTPYQAEISQGRLEALLNFQTLVRDLTAMDCANASLLDEATAAAEAMTLCRRVRSADAGRDVFVVSDRCHPQTIAVVETRAEPLGIEVVVTDAARWGFERPTFGLLLQYPTTDGEIPDYGPLAERAHEHGALVVVAADLLSLVLLRPPGEFGADVVVGSSQRFGVPVGYGGPHAAFLATREAYKRQIPGRIVGVSVDREGRPALRLALQTREQHIRRERATSNICTAQVLLAVVASLYAVYHGPEGLRRIARRIRAQAALLADGLERAGWTVRHSPVFDTLRVGTGPLRPEQVLDEARRRKINLRPYEDGDLGVSLDETVELEDLADLLACFRGSAEELRQRARDFVPEELPAPHARRSPFLTHPVFHRYHSETELLRYIKRLESRDLSLTTSMIPLGSCTMKLNGAAEMMSISHPGWADLHPFAPPEQAAGYGELLRRLERALLEITGFAALTFMPNAGSQGEYTGLLVIRAYHRARGEGNRDVCLIPASAHGTNPASAALAGLKVVTVACDEAGNVDVADLEAKLEEYAPHVAALMITYPSTHGVFEERIVDISELVHRAGGQVYFDGANLNALVGLCRPAELGADACHLNLHKTFSIPHGGGGPGAGPVCVAPHLAPFLPRHPLVPTGGTQGIGPVSAAPYGSPSVLPISYAYIALMGARGLERASQVAILNANYVARRLDPYFPVVYRGRNGFVAHECLVDLRRLRTTAGIEPDDVAKRLMDYGFHAPTMSWPVPGTFMIEPTESESVEELDRFCEAMISIREEIRDIEEGRADPAVNLLKMAPHTAEAVASDRWDRPYSRERAAFPAAWTRRHKFWPPVARVDNAYGDRNLVCARPPVGEPLGL